VFQALLLIILKGGGQTRDRKDLAESKTSVNILTWREHLRLVSGRAPCPWRAVRAAV
jgi:hypothetical protein